MRYFFACLIGYLLGSTTLALVIGDVFYNRDVRNEGSGNMGATNVTRSFGPTAGVITLLWDIGKCILAMRIGSQLAGEAGLAGAAFACFAGHCFPCLHKFRGGKGVAVGAAIAFAVSWKAFLVVFLVFLVVVFLSRRVSLGSVCAALGLAVVSYSLLSVSPSKAILGIASGIFIIAMHRENIIRLVTGREPAFTLPK